jgi:hypothetical protein
MCLGHPRNQHPFITCLIKVGYDIRFVQELLGHKDVKTTMVYTHVLNQGPKGVRSPMDEVWKGYYTDQYKTPSVQSKNTQGMGNEPVRRIPRLGLSVS